MHGFRYAAILGLKGGLLLLIAPVFYALMSMHKVFLDLMRFEVKAFLYAAVSVAVICGWFSWRYKTWRYVVLAVLAIFIARLLFELEVSLLLLDRECLFVGFFYFPVVMNIIYRNRVAEQLSIFLFVLGLVWTLLAIFYPVAMFVRLVSDMSLSDVLQVNTGFYYEILLRVLMLFPLVFMYLLGRHLYRCSAIRL